MGIDFIIGSTKYNVRLDDDGLLINKTDDNGLHAVVIQPISTNYIRLK